jgi:uncharacterized oxidoreductase
MKMSGNTVLITGGATGIGLALAESFLDRGNEVIICGRREERLRQAQQKHPSLHTRVCDVSAEKDRRSLVAWTTENFSSLNIVVNNAGIQRAIDFTEGIEDFLDGESETAIDLEAPIHLCGLFIPHLAKMKEPAIVNVSSGLAITPAAVFPVYCAVKAGLHTFTKCLRFQLRKTGIRVFEVLPPGVDSELNMKYREKRGQAFRGIKAEDYAAFVMKGLENDELEITNPALEKLKNENATLSDLDQLFESMNSRWH